MNRWLISRAGEAGVRLYCFPYVGGGSGDFARWAERLPGVAVYGVVPPGRGGRLGEPPFSRLADLVDALVAEVEFQEPFAFFGHSLGALIGYETARALRAAGRAGPEVLVVSGHRPPHLPSADEPIHGLPWPDFRAEVERRYPPPPPELLEDEELYADILTTLRADLSVFETYEHVPGPPLVCPIVVISGETDVWTEAELIPWRQHTSGGCRIHMVYGDHFYLTEHSDQAIRIICDALGSRGRRP